MASPTPHARALCRSVNVPIALVDRRGARAIRRRATRANASTNGTPASGDARANVDDDDERRPGSVGRGNDGDVMFVNGDGATRRAIEGRRAMEGRAANGDEGERLRDGGARGDDDARRDSRARDASSSSPGMARGSGARARSSSGGASAIRGANAARAQTAEILLTRGLILNKLVVTRTSGSRLGVATDLWVDTDTWEVVALDVRQNAFVGTVDHVLLESLRQVGDVILVHDERAVERRWSSYGYSAVVGKDVVTESGQFIGRVRDFEFDPEDGAIARLIVDAWGVPTVPEGVVSTYAVDVVEILDCGTERIIVAEDAESRVEQLSMSVLQRLALTVPPWEEEEMMFGSDAYYDDVYYDDYGRAVPSRSRRRADVDEYEAFFRRRGGAARGVEQRQSSGSPVREGIPLMRPTQAYERRDVDGGYGDRPGFSDWVVRDDRRQSREYETVDAYWDPPARRERAAARRPPADARDARDVRASPPPRDARPPPRSRRAPPPRSRRAPPSGAFDASEDML